MFQACINAGLFAKIAGERNDPGRAFLGGMELLQIVQRGIFAAIVDENDFVIIAAAGKGAHHSILECGNVFGFVITGDNEGKFHNISSQRNFWLL